MKDDFSVLVDWVLQLGFLEEKLENLKHYEPILFDIRIGDGLLAELSDTRQLAAKLKDKYNLSEYETETSEDKFGDKGGC